MYLEYEKSQIVDKFEMNEKVFPYCNLPHNSVKQR